jgi:diaminopimelate epimerase
MTTIPFYKYQGAGNDFVLIDNRKNQFNNLDVKTVNLLCNRHFGIGADGLMMLQSSDRYDFEMAYYNADGRLGSMCGNGGRCIVAFAYDLGVIKNETNFLAVDGTHYAKVSDNGSWINLEMIDVEQIENDGDAFVLNTGSPHYVVEKSDLANLDVYKEGFAIRNNTIYKTNGINVNFVEQKADGLFVRTFERGVEDETLACGTGVTASAMAFAHKNKQLGEIETAIETLGGRLQVSFNFDGQNFTQVFLSGPAKKVFSGQITI